MGFDPSLVGKLPRWTGVRGGRGEGMGWGVGPQARTAYRVAWLGLFDRSAAE